MSNDWATENLQIIRTLMEKAAIYRRALAPLMIMTGSLGIAASVVPCFVDLTTTQAFVVYWQLVGLCVLLIGFLLVRRQALKESEPFWSPPLRRISWALLPGLSAGLVLGLFFLCPHLPMPPVWVLPFLWMIFYGCALHSAGFFMQRGIKLFGGLFIMASLVGLYSFGHWDKGQTPEAAHYVMGTGFGVLHLIYGVYLYFTEKRNAL